MRNHLKMIPVVVIFALGFGTVARTQEKPAPAPARQQPEIIPLRVQVVISKYQGEKKISSLPYTLSVNANQGGPGASLRMGAEVPITTRTVSPDGKQNTSFNYRSIGTNIDCSANATDDGRFRLNIAIEESSVYTGEVGQGEAIPKVDAPVFRNFRSTNMLILKDGQSAQFTTATDRITGEVIRADVTLNVMK